jgi:hypothetical protein
MTKTKKKKLPPEILEAIKDKIKALKDMEIVTNANADITQRRFELAIETQPNRNPYAVMDILAHTLMEEAWG